MEKHLHICGLSKYICLFCKKDVLKWI
jgi:hypothetical protein